MNRYLQDVQEAARTMHELWLTGTERYYPAQQIGTIAGTYSVSIEQVKQDVRAQFDLLVDLQTV